MPLVDVAMTLSVALPNGASETHSLPIDAGGKQLAGHTIIVEVPALTVAELPDAETLSVGFEQSDDGDEWETLVTLTEQTGADGAGAAAATKRYALPSSAKRYVRLVAANTGAGDATGKIATARFEF